MSTRTDRELLSPYGVGVVATSSLLEDKGVIDVSPLNMIVQHDGELKDTSIMEATIKMNKTVRVAEVERVVTIRARWMHNEGNTVTAPLLKHGEQVKLYKMRDTDEFYWENLFSEHDLRRRETKIDMVGNTEEFGVPLNADNTYYKIISTIEKFVKFFTNDNDGELTWYEFLLNTKKGHATLIDGKGNEIKLYSDENKLIINVDTIHIIATESVTIDTPLMTINTDEYVLNSISSYKLSTQNCIMNTDQYTGTYRKMSMSGDKTFFTTDFNVFGSQTLVGDYSLEGGINVSMPSVFSMPTTFVSTGTII